MHTQFQWEIPWEIYAQWEINIKLKFKNKCVGVCTGLIWLRRGFSGDLFESELRISWLFEQFQLFQQDSAPWRWMIGGLVDWKQVAVERHWPWQNSVQIHQDTSRTDTSPKLPKVTFAHSTDLWGQYVYQSVHSPQRQARTYSTGTQVIYYFALKLATETRRESRRRLGQKWKIFPSFLHNLRQGSLQRVAEPQGLAEILSGRSLDTILSYFYPQNPPLEDPT